MVVLCEILFWQVAGHLMKVAQHIVSATGRIGPQHCGRFESPINQATQRSTLQHRTQEFYGHVQRTSDNLPPTCEKFRNLGRREEGRGQISHWPSTRRTTRLKFSCSSILVVLCCCCPCETLRALSSEPIKTTQKRR